MTAAPLAAPLIDRVRERLAAEPGPLRPAVVAAAIRAESGGVLGDTEVLAGLRLLQTELTGAGPLDPLLAGPGVTDVLVSGPDSVWVDTETGWRAAQFDSTTRPRCAGWRSGWHWPPASASMMPSPGSTAC